jgi:hypothetical protein
MGDWFDIPSESWNTNNNHIIVVMPIYIKRLSILNNNPTESFVKYAIHPELDGKITYSNTEHFKVKRHQLKELRQDTNIDNRIVALIPISTTYISQHSQVEIQFTRDSLGKLFSDKIEGQDLKPSSINYILKLILDNAKKFSQSTQKLSFQNVDPFEYYIYQLLSVSFPCVWIGLFEGDWKKILEQEGFAHTVDFILNAPKSILLIECNRQFTSDRSAIGEVELKKLLHVKEKLETYGLNVYAILICAEYYKTNSEFFDSVSKRYHNIHFIFKEGLEKIESQIHLMTDHINILKFSQRYRDF